jgi:hypothetical protein
MLQINNTEHWTNKKITLEGITATISLSKLELKAIQGLLAESGTLEAKIDLWLRQRFLIALIKQERAEYNAIKGIK